MMNVLNPIETNDYFDATDIFWDFINLTLKDAKFTFLSFRNSTSLIKKLQTKQKIIMKKNCVWIDEKDIMILDFPLHQDYSYDIEYGFYIFESMFDLFVTLFRIYEKIINTTIINEERKNCIRIYQQRYQKLRRAYDIIISEMSSNNVEEMFEIFSRIKI